MNYKQGLHIVLDKLLNETTLTDTGVFGSNIEQHGGDVGNSDFYAPGDSRNPFGLNVVGNSSKKRKGKKKKRFHLYRRAFVSDTPTVLECNIFCSDEYNQLVGDVLCAMNVYNIPSSSCITIIDTDDTIREAIDHVYGVLGDNFEDNVKVFIYESTNSLSILKKPKQKLEDYNTTQLRRGTKIEMEHTEDPRVARIIAMNHLDEDPLYYDKLEKMESKHTRVGRDK